jgi:hypothetical protein
LNWERADPIGLVIPRFYCVGSFTLGKSSRASIEDRNEEKILLLLPLIPGQLEGEAPFLTRSLPSRQRRLVLSSVSASASWARQATDAAKAPHSYDLQAPLVPIRLIHAR